MLSDLPFLKLKRELFKQGVKNEDVNRCKDKDELLRLAKEHGITTVQVRGEIEDPAASKIQGAHCRRCRELTFVCCFPRWNEGL